MSLPPVASFIPLRAESNGDFFSFFFLFFFQKNEILIVRLKKVERLIRKETWDVDFAWFLRLISFQR